MERRSCPICKRPVEKGDTNDAYPFCSSRCRLLDLGNWLTDRYRISEKLPDSDGIDTGVPEEPARE
jgi:endogenous inhibitor of DNA gyrase (YacG/DUF329 family)